MIAKSKFTQTERDATGGCFVGGLAMIFEFATPFATGNPLLYIPCFMAGGAVGAISSYLFGCTMVALRYAINRLCLRLRSSLVLR